jgi:dienelactone hydrolase
MAARRWAGADGAEEGRGLLTPRFHRLGPWVAVLAAAALWTSAAGAQQEVRIDSGRGGEAVALKAFWFPAEETTPSGNAANATAAASAQPAVVLLHGCSGLYGRDGRLAARYDDYLAQLRSLGMHALVVDSLGARGEKEICTQKVGERRVTQAHRRQDTLAALAWLSAQPGVDAGRLGLLGWSHGGSAVLAATNENHAEVRRATARAAFAAAFYPGCAAELKQGYASGARLLMLLGGSDDWTPPQPCVELAKAAVGAAPQVEVYPGAFHGFDSTAALRVRKDVPNGVNPGQGVTVGGDREAREKSLQHLKEFLAAQR